MKPTDLLVLSSLGISEDETLTLTAGKATGGAIYFTLFLPNTYHKSIDCAEVEITELQMLPEGLKITGWIK